MVRQSNTGDDFDAETELIRIEAEGIAKRHGIDTERVIAIYKRSPDICLFPVLAPFRTNLDRAIAILEKEKALQLFETEDLGKLAERVFLVDEFNNFQFPLYCLDELQQATENFITHLLKNRTHLLDTGRCPSKFHLSPWLDRQLGCLYHFDFPAGFLPPPKEDRVRLKADRAKLLDLKVSILTILHRAIKRELSANLWDDCLRVLTETVSAEEAEFYLRMDHFYMGYDLTDRGAPEEIPGLDRPGGFTDLLEVIGHFEKELTIGTLAETHDALGDLLKFDEFNRPRLFLRNYFEAINHPLKDVLDPALDLFLSLESKESDFWNNYRNRVNQALENDFYGEIPGEKVKRKFMHSFEPLMKKLSILIKAHFEATGRLPRISISEGEDTKTQDQYVFRQEGQIWTTIYNGITKRFEDAKGFHYIAHLLSNRGNEIGVSELVAAVEKQTDQLSGTIYSKMTAEQLEELNLTSSYLDDGGKIIDNESEIAYRHRLDSLREEYEVNISNPEKAAEIKEELNFIKKELSAVKDLGGRTRKFPTPKGTTQKAVSRAILRSLKIIKNYHPDLYSHLNNALRPISAPFCYNPNPPIDWITE